MLQPQTTYLDSSSSSSHRTQSPKRTMVVTYLPEYESDETHPQHHGLEPAIPPFAGRMGGNQDFVVDRTDPKNSKVLERVPDAAPCMTLKEIFDLRGFLSVDLWKFAVLECIGNFPAFSETLNNVMNGSRANKCITNSKHDECLHHLLGNNPPTIRNNIPQRPSRRLRNSHLLLPNLRRPHQPPTHTAAHLHLLPFQWRPYQPHYHTRHLLRAHYYFPAHDPLPRGPNARRRTRRLCHALRVRHA